jgi:hypothetical protein
MQINYGLVSQAIREIIIYTRILQVGLLIQTTPVTMGKVGSEIRQAWGIKSLVGADAVLVEQIFSAHAVEVMQSGHPLLPNFPGVNAALDGLNNLT